MFLIPGRPSALLLQPNYSTREQCDAFLGRSVGPGAPGPVERGARHRALRKQSCSAEMKYGRASHYTETCSSHLVIDGLGGGLCPSPPLRNCLLYGGGASLKQCWKTKDASFSLVALPVSLLTSLKIDTRVRVHICGHTRSFSQAVSGF